MPRSLGTATVFLAAFLLSLPTWAQELTEEWGYDRKGDDYTSFRAYDVAECKASCRRDRRCQAYTFTNDRVCYLKSRINSKKQAFGAVTGYKQEPSGEPGHPGGGWDGRELTEERGYDRRGDDYTSFRARGLGDCKLSCAREERCRAYTFDTRNDVCYLKSRINSASRNGAMITGYKRDDGGSGSTGGGWGDGGDLTEERGYDRKGDDYTSFRARGLRDCKAACRKDDRCRAYTFDTRNDVCYLKSRINSKKVDSGMVTGYKTDE